MFLHSFTFGLNSFFCLSKRRLVGSLIVGSEDARLYLYNYIYIHVSFDYKFMHELKQGL